MIKLLGIPFDANSSFLRGPAHAPQRIRLMDSEGSANQYTESGQVISPGDQIEDLGDLDFADVDPKKGFEKINKAVSEAIADGSKLLSLGGDHSVSYPIVAAYAAKYPGLHVLHLDAHADLYDNFENNPFSHASPFARIMETGKIGSLTQVGIRTLTTHQRAQVARFNIKVVEMKDFNHDFISELKGPLYLSLDLDGLDPAFAPGVSHHEPGGMSTRQVLDILQQLGVEVVGADIVEYNPTRDVHHMTAMVAYKLMKELMGKML